MAISSLEGPGQSSETTGSSCTSRSSRGCRRGLFRPGLLGRDRPRGSREAHRYRYHGRERDREEQHSHAHPEKHLPLSEPLTHARRDPRPEDSIPAIATSIATESFRPPDTRRPRGNWARSTLPLVPGKPEGRRLVFVGEMGTHT